MDMLRDLMAAPPVAEEASPVGEMGCGSVNVDTRTISSVASLNAPWAISVRSLAWRTGTKCAGGSLPLENTRNRPSMTTHVFDGSTSGSHCLSTITRSGGVEVIPTTVAIAKCRLCGPPPQELGNSRGIMAVVKASSRTPSWRIASGEDDVISTWYRKEISSVMSLSVDPYTPLTGVQDVDSDPRSLLNDGVVVSGGIPSTCGGMVIPVRSTGMVVGTSGIVPTCGEGERLPVVMVGVAGAVTVES